MNKGLLGTVLLLASIFGGCGHNEPVSPGQAAVTSAVEPLSGFKATLNRSNDVPNQVSVQLTWTGGDKFQGIYRISRSGGGSEDQFSAAPNEQGYLDRSVKPGMSYSYHLDAVSSAGAQEMGKASLSVPKDLVITGVVDAATLSNPSRVDENLIDQYDRIFLDENAHLQGGYKPLVIRTARLVALGKAGAWIESLTEKAVAPSLTDGKPGGDIFVSATSASGLLFILARGEKGGTGPQGPEGPRGRPGSSDGFISPGRGSPGGIGLQGRSGGDSGPISVKISDPDPGFQIFPRAEPGLGGDGGPGGRGGPWGPYPSRPDLEPQVINGERAASGPIGPVGPAGKQSAICLEIGKFRAGC